MIYTGEDSQAVALVNWWLVLKSSGDVELAFRETGLINWLRLFEPPADFIFDVDDKGIWIGALFSERDGGVNLSFWVRKDRRSSKGMLRWWEELHTNVLEIYPFVLISSRIDSVVEQAVRLGYTEIGPVPDGSNRLAIIDKEMWDDRAKKHPKRLADADKRTAVAAG